MKMLIQYGFDGWVGVYECVIVLVEWRGVVVAVPGASYSVLEPVCPRPVETRSKEASRARTEDSGESRATEEHSSFTCPHYLHFPLFCFYCYH